MSTTEVSALWFWFGCVCVGVRVGEWVCRTDGGLTIWKDEEMHVEDTRLEKTKTGMRAHFQSEPVPLSLLPPSPSLPKDSDRAGVVDKIGRFPVDEAIDHFLG